MGPARVACATQIARDSFHFTSVADCELIEPHRVAFTPPVTVGAFANSAQKAWTGLQPIGKSDGNDCAFRGVNVPRVACEKAPGPKIKFEDIVGEVGGVYSRIMKEGDMDAGAWSCGMVADFTHDIPTVKELIDRTMNEADAIIGRRLATFMQA